MKENIANRVKEETSYILKTFATVREVAKKFKVSKSTAHKDLHERLKLINKEHFKKVEEILNFHTSIRHIRGGESTKNKYLKIA
jgi:putative DeoR family transcriptional regulator (stage III sporulation protein D)